MHLSVGGHVSNPSHRNTFVVGVFHGVAWYCAGHGAVFRSVFLIDLVSASVARICGMQWQKKGSMAERWRRATMKEARRAAMKKGERLKRT
jgi:hypothetical protein